jgi:hypothetical protein
MEQSPSSLAIATQLVKKIPLLWNPKVHYHVHGSLALNSNLSQFNPFHLSHPFPLRSILIFSSDLCVDDYNYDVIQLGT